MIALLLVSPAWATNYNVDICAKIAVDFSDADLANGDDYIRDNHDQPARGAHLVLYEVSPLPPYTIISTVADEWALASGTSAGCLSSTQVLSSGKSYRIRIYSEALVNGQTVEVYDDPDNGTTLTADTGAPWIPLGGGTRTLTTSGDYEVWNILAAGGYAVWRNDLGNSTGTVTAYSAADGSFYENTYDAVHIWSSGTVANYLYKNVIAHEFGHALMHRRYDDPGSDLTADDTNCPGVYPTDKNGHYFVSSEFEGGAFWEGFAHYYAAVAFNNDTTETDCSFHTYKPYDFDQDGDDEDAQPVDCAGNPVIDNSPETSPASFTITGADYYGTNCIADGAHNRATELDWLEFLWHLDTTGTLAPEDFGTIYAYARANYTWNETGDGSGTNYPAYDLLSAANALHSTTWGAQWANHDQDYGVNR